MGGCGPDSPTFNFGLEDSGESKLKLQKLKTNDDTQIDDVEENEEADLDDKIGQDFAELEKNLANFKMDQNDEGEEDDSYPTRGFSFAGEMAPSRPSAENMDEMKAKLKEEMMK